MVDPTPGAVFPSLSVITVNLDGGPSVGRTIASLRGQGHPFEWVVVDGGSGDGSGEALRAALRPGDRFVSERDRGISDAFNKGLALASGEAVLFMNAGDAVASPDALGRLLAAWDHRRWSWATGSAQVLDANGRVLFSRPMDVGQDPRELVRRGCRIFHQATVARRESLLAAGGFDLSYRISMDYDLWLRLLARGEPPQLVDVVVCRFHTGGASGAVRRRLQEERRARAAHGCANSWWSDTRLAAIARLKEWAAPAAGPLAYRLKERLRW